MYEWRCVLKSVVWYEVRENCMGMGDLAYSGETHGGPPLCDIKCCLFGRT